MTKQIYFTRINFAKILEKCVKYSYILDRQNRLSDIAI